MGWLEDARVGVFFEFVKKVFVVSDCRVGHGASGEAGRNEDGCVGVNVVVGEGKRGS